MRTIVPWLLLLSLPACVDLEDEPALGTTDEAIVSGTAAADWMVERAVKPQYPCTATLIAPRFALTALHCTTYNKAGTTVHFYTSAAGFAPALARTVTAVHVPIGTATPPEITDHYYDLLGRYADIAILELASAAPASSVSSTLAWAYPGPGAAAYPVGAGNHDGAGTNPNSVGELRYALNYTESDDDAVGYFLVANDRTNPGDSGGPRYRSRKVLGVVHGGTRYTSVPLHMPWILAVINYAWPYGASQSGIYRLGTLMERFDGATEKMCQYACDHSPCDAYNWLSSASRCDLMQDVVGSISFFPYRSDAK